MHAFAGCQPRTNLIVRCPVPLREGLRALAQREGETSSVIVRRLIADAVRTGLGANTAKTKDAHVEG